MKYRIFIICYLLYAPWSHADEGMWLPTLVGQQKMDEMRKKGLRLSAEDLYSINQASIKDAIVLFSRGCTAAIVSGDGLILTNHHCGLSWIQKHSSIEHDYLKDGFWAMAREEEIPDPGLTVSLLVRMEEVTERVLARVKPGMSETERQQAVSEASGEIISEATADTHFQGEVKPLFNGNQYFLYVTEVFRDVRLVGAPPSAIGNFGGDTDNWKWPRHTGDFSIFRIYADSSNSPAEYSPANRPYHPRKYLPVSLEGVDKGDFTLVYGFPGTTRQYVPSFLVDMVARVLNPLKIEIRGRKLEILAAEMAANPEIRIRYASKYNGVANYWKKWAGECWGLKRFSAVERKESYEKQFQLWADSMAGGYSGLLENYRAACTEMEPVQVWIDRYSEAIRSLDIIRFASGFRDLAAMDKSVPESIRKESERLRKSAADYFRDYDPDTDKKLLNAMLEYFRNTVRGSELPGIYYFIEDKYGGNINEYTDWLYDHSFMVSREKAMKFLEDYTAAERKHITSDPAYRLMLSFHSRYTEEYRDRHQRLTSRMDSLQRIYMQAVMEKEKDRILFPDANSTLRISYGVVNGCVPGDAVYYDYQTTLAGIMEKEDPEVDDYLVPAKLKELFEAGDYGRYGENDRLYVCFTAANHTTNGNSGSPVLDGRGRLIGLNFDRNWEGTMSDYLYDPGMCRNIVVDIRYCLFIIDKFAGAGHLIDEMEITE